MNMNNAMNPPPEPAPQPVSALGPAFRKPSKAGRKTKLNEELQELIVQLIRSGNYIETAAAVAGVDKKNLYAWLKRGARSRRGKYARFRNAVIKALGEGEALDVARIRLAAEQGDWRAAAWRLERRHTRRWGVRQRLEHSGAKDGPPIRTESKHSRDDVDWSKLTVEELHVLRDLRERAEARSEPGAVEPTPGREEPV